MGTHSPRTAFAAALLVLTLAVSASAQATAQLNGRVTDESGAERPPVHHAVRGQVWLLGEGIR
jgi:hypothetical protein